MEIWQYKTAITTSEQSPTVDIKSKDPYVQVNTQTTGQHVFVPMATMDRLGVMKPDGKTTTVDANGVLTAVTPDSQGIGIITQGAHQSAVGTYNDNKEDNIFEVGNGSPEQRSNAFEVTTDGIARAYGEPQDTYDIVRKKELLEVIDLIYKAVAEIVAGADESYDTLKEISD